MAAKKKAVFLTLEGLEKLKEELAHLIEVRRPEISAKLKRALEFGDLSENAEYQEAREDQAMTEARISELEEQIRNSEIIEDKSGDFTTSNAVQMGSKVTVVNMKGDESEREEEVYVIVGTTEANPLEGRISNESPLGNALLDHKVGDVVKFKAPAGMQEYKIVALD